MHLDKVSNIYQRRTVVYSSHTCTESSSFQGFGSTAMLSDHSSSMTYNCISHIIMTKASKLHEIRSSICHLTHGLEFMCDGDKFD